MLKQIVVDKVMARQLWKLGFKEPTLSYYDVDGQLQNAEGDTLELKDYNAPKETRGRGARCYSAPTLSAVQDWLRRKKHLELLVCRDTFFQNTGDYYCRLIRLSDGLSRDTHPRKSYDQALMDGIKQAIALLSLKFSWLHSEFQTPFIDGLNLHLMTILLYFAARMVGEYKENL